MKNLTKRECKNSIILSVIVFATVGAFMLFSALRIDAQEILGDLPGRIKTLRGEGIPGISVTAINRDTGKSFTTITDNEGFYVFEKIPVGRYRIKFSHSGFAEKIIDVIVNIGQTNILETLFGTEVELGKGNIKGIITDKDEKAISGVFIKITNKITKDVIEVVTGADGKYEIKDLDTGKYDIEVKSEDYKKKKDDFRIENGKTKTKDFELKRAKN